MMLPLLQAYLNTWLCDGVNFMFLLSVTRHICLRRQRASKATSFSSIESECSHKQSIKGMKGGRQTQEGGCYWWHACCCRSGNRTISCMCIRTKAQNDPKAEKAQHVAIWRWVDPCMSACVRVSEALPLYNVSKREPERGEDNYV